MTLDDPDSYAARLRTREARLRALDRRWISGPTSRPYRWFVAAWTVAVLARFTLVDLTRGGWILASIVLGVGTFGLLLRGGRLWWLLSAVALLAPLLLLQDWMTQSAVMLVVSGFGVATAGADDDGDAVRDAARTLVVFTCAVDRLCEPGARWDLALDGGWPGLCDRPGPRRPRVEARRGFGYAADIGTRVVHPRRTSPARPRWTAHST